MKRLIPLILALFLTVPVLATTYYVDATDGNDGNSGTTTGQAWKTIGKVNSMMGSFSPGDSILFQRGETWSNQTLDISCSGTSGNLITFGDYGTGDKPVFTGASSGILFNGGEEYIAVEDIKIQNIGGVGIALYNQVASYIYLDRLDLVNIGGNGIYGCKFSYFYIRDCTITTTGVGGITIYGSETDKANHGWISGCTVDGADTDGINIHRDDSLNSLGDYWYVGDNIVKNSGENAFDFTSGKYALVIDNEFYGSYDDGTLIGQGSDDEARYVWLINNYTHDHTGAPNCWSFYLGGAKDIYGIANIMYNSEDGPLNTGGGTGYAYSQYWYNNTMVMGAKNTSADHIMNITSAFQTVFHFKNNICQTISSASDIYGPYLYGGATDNYDDIQGDFDYNYYYNPGSGDIIFRDADTYPLTFAQWKARSGSPDPNSVHGTDPELTDFIPDSGSPVIDSGTWITTVNGNFSNQTNITLDDATVFHDTWGGFLDSGMTLMFEGDSTEYEVTAVNYGTEVVTLDQAVTVSDGDGVHWKYKGSGPDIGAKEYDSGTPAVTFASTPYSISESGGQKTITVSISEAPSGVTASVDYATSDGSAEAGSDYTATNDTLSWTSGDGDNKTFNITITSDGTPEDDETIVITLSNPVNCTISGTNPVNCTILDDDEPPTVSFSAANFNAGEGDGQATITVNISDAPDGFTATVDYATSNGTAESGTDYTATNDTLSWTSGQSSPKSFNVSITEDGQQESDETVNLTLSNPSNCTITGTNPATLTILDNDSGGGGGSGSYGGRTHYKPVTIQHAYIDGDLTNVLALVKIDSDSDIGGRCQADMDDVTFFLSDGETQLDHSPPFGVSVGGGSASAFYWVECSPTASAGLEIHCAYGDESATGDGAWADILPTAYKIFCLFDENTGSTADDKTANENDPTYSGSLPAQVSGIEHYAQSLDGTGDSIDWSAGEPVDLDESWTFSMFVYWDSLASQRYFLNAKSGGGAQGLISYIKTDGQFNFTYTDSDGDHYIYGDTVTAAQWFHQAWIKSGSTITEYRNGVSTEESCSGCDHTLTNSDNLTLGEYAGTRNFSGDIQFFIAYQGDLGANWLKFHYRNVSEADNELTWDSESEVPSEEEEETTGGRKKPEKKPTKKPVKKPVKK